MLSRTQIGYSLLAAAVFVGACAGPTREEFNSAVDGSGSPLTVKGSYDVPRPFAAVMTDIRANAPRCFNRVRANAVAKEVTVTEVFIVDKGAGRSEVSLKMGNHFLLTVDIAAKGANATTLSVRQFNAWSNGEAASLRSWAMGENANCKYGILELPI